MLDWLFIASDFRGSEGAPLRVGGHVLCEARHLVCSLNILRME